MESIVASDPLTLSVPIPSLPDSVSGRSQTPAEIGAPEYGCPASAETKIHSGEEPVFRGGERSFHDLFRVNVNTSRVADRHRKVGAGNRLRVSEELCGPAPIRGV